LLFHRLRPEKQAASCRAIKPEKQQFVAFTKCNLAPSN